MEIPITISFNGNSAELDRDLFGLGDIVTDENILKYIPKSDEPLRYVNKEGTLMEGVTIKPKPNQTVKIEESVESHVVDYHYILSLIDTGLGIGMNAYAIADKLLEKIVNHTCKIAIGGKEVKTKDEFQKTLDEYVTIHS